MNHAGLYIHVPFCPRKCRYCDFYSKIPTADQCARCVEALMIELDRALELHRPERIPTIFVGGGTPTFLPAPLLDELLSRLTDLARTRATTELTIEANPGTLDTDKIAILAQHGLTRVSLGAQSFEPAELQTLGRIHNPTQIIDSARAIRDAGIEHLNLDLIFGIPGQTADTWEASLHRAIDLGADHLACYGLTYEPGTPLHTDCQAKRVVPASEELEALLYERMLVLLTDAGFEHYEISNFARPGGRCEHNLRYWYNADTIGIGPAAASYLNGQRWRNVPDVDTYLARVHAHEPLAVDVETLPPLQRAGETAMLRLRMTEGIDVTGFAQQTGYDPHTLFAEPIAEARSRGLLEVTPERIRLTRPGLLLADAVMAEFLNPTLNQPEQDR